MECGYCFFFQAEDGIRDLTVTGVQTCALPICQPSALSAPNSLTRRETADIVSRLASRNAAASTAMASHRPSRFARLAVLASEPDTWLARSLELVTVTLGSSLEISFDTTAM